MLLFLVEIQSDPNNGYWYMSKFYGVTICNMVIVQGQVWWDLSIILGRAWLRALICIWRQRSEITSNVTFLFARSYLHLMTKSKSNYDLKSKFCPLHMFDNNCEKIRKILERKYLYVIFFFVLHNNIVKHALFGVRS